MTNKEILFTYEEYDSIEDLDINSAALLAKARKVTSTAYAPYSSFNVGAVALLANGETINGSNQENASYPVGICAERVLLSALSSIYPNTAIDTLAISYHNLNGESNRPVSPCGLCRQSLLEFETRFKHPIRIILSGMEGKVQVLANASSLLPMSFNGDDLK